MERSTRAATLRAEQRVQRFLDAAQELIAEKETTDFTVQEVVDRSNQSLRSFYQHFDGKHELLLALFEDALSATATEIRLATADVDQPLERVRIAVEILFEQSRPRPGLERPLFSDFALRLQIEHPDQVATARLPLLAVFTELLAEATSSGVIPINRPRNQAFLVIQTITFAARVNDVAINGDGHRVTIDEVWQFCLGGISGA
ncbi:hypothetical protein SGFS_097180 [Streptomyces graminofaciens]|uniref:HTH tetR-type domain-containing protein n=1 Tax=Streptomyces graminofaciens TaxID=68212 RepID=A0ABN5VYB2_9ACTN|nr:TetR/AcrR family transcriptional regulator [Streptomyces graminofaciens]BBC38424.1 hypothetical protein SGFS_097180 [Streptomyces graminofaciens]